MSSVDEARSKTCSASIGCTDTRAVFGANETVVGDTALMDVMANCLFYCLETVVCVSNHKVRKKPDGRPTS